MDILHAVLATFQKKQLKSILKTKDSKTDLKGSLFPLFFYEIHNGDVESKERLKEHLVRGINSYATWKRLDASDVEKMLYETSENFKECYDASYGKEED